jgi:oxygen-independent coproporphyrinogen-3 oxidase
LGIQSFQPRLLDALGRQHTPEQAFKAAERLHAAGFDNVNYDLMFALPGQDDEDWMRDLDQAIALAPAHISTYCLTFEEDTKLWLKLSQGRIRRDVEAEARLYTATWERLAAAGYAQYEISNFARPGRACLHNLNTWRMQDWIGLGPSAASQQAGWRGTNIADLDKWCTEVAAGRRAGEDRQELSPELLAEDALIFGLRMNEGVDLAPLRARAPGADWAAVEAMAGELREGGLADVTASWIRLTPRGRLLADSVGERLLGLLSS